MVKTNQTFSSIGYFYEESNYKIFDDTEEFQEFLYNGNPNWWKLDSQILIEFLYLTLGEFSGYGDYLINCDEEEELV